MLTRNGAAHIRSRFTPLALGLIAVVCAVAVLATAGRMPDAEPSTPARAPAIVGHRLVEAYPPTATLEIDGVAHWLMRGTFSWDGTHFDMLGNTTSDAPVHIDAPATGTLRLGLDDAPQVLRLCVLQVGSWMAVAKGDGWVSWPTASCTYRRLPLQAEQLVPLDLVNGLHALEIHAAWSTGRSAHYGLLVAARGPSYIPLAMSCPLR